MEEVENKKLLKLYTLAEISYQNHFKNDFVDIDVLYPQGWYENKNYKEKIEIITEAIKTNKIISKTKRYKNIVESVKNYVKE